MKKLVSALVIVCSFLAVMVHAQGTEQPKGHAKLIGAVIDSETSQPVEFANIALVNQETNKPVDGAV